MNISHHQPVRLRNLHDHGLFGSKFVRHHMMDDERWTVNDLSDQFISMKNFLVKRNMAVRKMAMKTNRARVAYFRTLRKQCHIGQEVLKEIRVENNRRRIRNMLKNDKEKQRMYKRVPIERISTYIDQRTFTLRKERDRLLYQKKSLENKLENLKFSMVRIAERLKLPQQSYVEEEETRIADIQKKLSNHKIRLEAIIVLNSTLKKIIKVLRSDELFFDPILKSLQEDSNIQKMYINKILDLGKPVIHKFQKMKAQFEEYDTKVNKELKGLVKTINTQRRSSVNVFNFPRHFKKDTIDQARDHYTRTTKSMAALEEEFERLSDIIKRLSASVCSNASEIFLRVKQELDNNFKLKKKIVCDTLLLETNQTKKTFSEVLQEVLKHNLTDTQIHRAQYIEKLQQKINSAEEKETQLLQKIKENKDMFVVFRVFMWNLYDVLRYVYKSFRIPRVKYPVTYLKLPLLRFENFSVVTCPPEPIGDDVDVLYSIIHTKLSFLLKTYNELMAKQQRYQSIGADENHTDLCRSTFMADYIKQINAQEVNGPDTMSNPAEESKINIDDDYNYERDVKSRKQIKSRSTFVVDEGKLLSSKNELE